MVVNATEAPAQAEVIIVVETTSANGAYINELKTNYILPTLEYFHGGPLDEGGGNGLVYGLVSYKSADCHPGQPVSTYGPFTSPQNLVEAIDKLQFIGGRAETKACVTEALTTALACFEELGRSDVARHVLLVCCLPPYSAYAGGLVPQGAPATAEVAARALHERGVNLSIASARRVPALHALYEHAGEMRHPQTRNYAKDPRHLVLLRGYSLKERPPSPAPPPVPEITTDMYGQGRGVGLPAPRAAAPFPRAPPPRAAWPPPRTSLFASNSALLTQLAQPSYPPPTQPSQSSLQRMPGMMGSGPPQQPQPSGGIVGGAGASAMPSAGPSGAQPQPPQRTYIWSGVLEWMEKGKVPAEQKVTRLLPCQVSANSKDIEPELKVDTWPNKLLMQLMPKQLISNIGGQYLKDSKSVLFHLQPNEALDALTKVMVNGFAGCVHFSPMSSPPQCDIKVLILLYTPDKKAYLGFIPNNQATFVDRLKKVIQQQKITQIIKGSAANAMGTNPMGANSMGASSSMQQGNMGGSSGMQNAGMQGGGMQSGGMQSGGMQSGGMQNTGMQSSGMQSGGMQSGGMQTGGMQSGGMQSGGMQSSSMQSGGMQSGGMQSGGMQSGGMQSGGMQSGGMQSGGMQSGGMQSGGMQSGGMPSGSMAGGAMVSMGSGGQMGMNQGMMMGGSMGGQVPQQPKSRSQLEGLEAAKAARQQNLEKIQQLQQTLEAAHQQEAQFKSQMDIMSHLQQAQQQEQHYKQLEKYQQLQQTLEAAEQQEAQYKSQMDVISRLHQAQHFELQEQRKHQLQQQLQQQLRNGPAGAGPHTQRHMRPMMPSNPGLRHLLQQQQQQPRGGRPHM